MQKQLLLKEEKQEEKEGHNVKRKNPLGMSGCPRSCRLPANFWSPKSSLPTFQAFCMFHSLCSPLPIIQALHWPKGFLYLIFGGRENSDYISKTSPEPHILIPSFYASSRPLWKELLGQPGHRHPEFFSLFSKNAVCFINTIAVSCFLKNELHFNWRIFSCIVFTKPNTKI